MLGGFNLQQPDALPFSVSNDQIGPPLIRPETRLLDRHGRQSRPWNFESSLSVSIRDRVVDLAVGVIPERDRRTRQWRLIGLALVSDIDDGNVYSDWRYRVLHRRPVVYTSCALPHGDIGAPGQNYSLPYDIVGKANPDLNWRAVRLDDFQEPPVMPLGIRPKHVVQRESQHRLLRILPECIASNRLFHRLKPATILVFSKRG